MSTPLSENSIERVETQKANERSSSESPPLGVQPSISSTRRLSLLQARKRRDTVTSTVTATNYITLIPGSEPGVNPNDSRVDIFQHCNITAVDYSEDRIAQTELDNNNLKSFLNNDRPSWSKVRWINVNGLSWDCISAIAKHWNLHRLAIEDLLNTENRTKCDWYSDHAFIIFPMVKLIRKECDDSSTGHKRSFFKQIFCKKKKLNEDRIDQEIAEKQSGKEKTKLPLSESVTPFRTLQRYYGGYTERAAFMEKNSGLSNRGYLVSVEQVSIFLTADGSVVSFFENSADDIEPPIFQRLVSEHTILRSSVDPSMILQAIVDAVIDLAFPVIHAYQNEIGELEVDVLTDPDLHHTIALYILTSELSLLKSTISPMVGLINSLRLHKRDPSKKTLTGHVYGVEISETGKTYFADVEDHCLMLMDHLDTMKRGADNMIDLIFNTVSCLQNETMRKLTLVTIFFLPLTFLTGYFGQNFEEFGAIRNSVTYFWKIAIPITTCTALWLLRDTIKRWIFAKSKRHAFKRGLKRREEQRNRMKNNESLNFNMNPTAMGMKMD